MREVLLKLQGESKRDPGTSEHREESEEKGA